MSNLFPTVVLAVVQGITEFLPISSDGHLAVTGSLLTASGYTIRDPFHLTVALHIGTLLAVVVTFRQQLLGLLRSDRRVIPLLLVGTIPAAVLGIFLHKYAKPLLHDPLAAGGFLVLNGFVLLYGQRHRHGEQAYKGMSWHQALTIGCCQAAAVLPGISRSGTTIVGGMRCGLGRPEAAAFSFLLSVPAILGAVVLEFKDEMGRILAGQTLQSDPLELGVGVLVSFLVGMLALDWLLKLVNRAKFHYFAYWCFASGFLAVVWNLSHRAA